MKKHFYYAVGIIQATAIVTLHPGFWLWLGICIGAAVVLTIIDNF